MFSCIILTKNEAGDIGRCLKSIAECDDIHIVDSGSTDDTRERALSSGIAHAWITHAPDGEYQAAEQRNWALNNLAFRHRWILFLDADEVANSKFLASIKSAISTAPDDLDAAYCAPRFLYHGVWLRRTKSYPTWEPRLLRHDRVRFLPGSWERFPAEIKTTFVRTPYDHYANSKGLAAWIQKHLMYASWEAQAKDTLGPQSTARRWAARVGPFRPFIVYLWFLIVRRGIFEGPEGWSYARRMLVYELLVREAIVEHRVKQRGRPL